MRRSEMRPDALPHRGAATPLRVAIGLAVAASAGVMLWGVGTQSVLASEFGRNLAAENPMTLEDTVAELTAELAQVRAETAKLRENQSDAAKELSRFRASLVNAEIGLAELRTTAEESEAHRRHTAAQVASNVAQLKNETLHLRTAQADTAAEIGSLRAGLANTEIGADSLRATTWQLSQQIERIEAGRDATGSIAKRHKHQGHKKWMAQR
jgi:chromosome segregation ATPase